MKIITATPARTEGPRFYGRNKNKGLSTGLPRAEPPRVAALLFRFIREHPLGSHKPCKNAQGHNPLSETLGTRLSFANENLRISER